MVGTYQAKNPVFGLVSEDYFAVTASSVVTAHELSEAGKLVLGITNRLIPTAAQASLYLKSEYKNSNYG